MKMNFAVATLVLGSVLIAAPGPAPAAPDHRGHGVSASHVSHRDRGHKRERRGDHRRYGRHRDSRGHRGASRHRHAPFSHRGHGKSRHYRGYRYRRHHYLAPGYHYHRHRPLVRLYADYDAYFHCPTHGGYFALADLYYH